LVSPATEPALVVKAKNTEKIKIAKVILLFMVFDFLI
jgi:hypothetical protein